MSGGLFLAATVALTVATGRAEGPRIWYRAPAADSIAGWERESIPIGCGWFGVNVFGGVTNERLQVTHNAVLSVREDNGYPNLTDALEIRLKTSHAAPTDYSRGLDLATGTAWTEYVSDGVRYRREIAASYPARAMLVRMTASEKGRLDFTLEAEAPFLHPFGVKRGARGIVGRTAKCAVSRDEIDVYQRLERFKVNFDSRLRVVTDGRVEKVEREGEGGGEGGGGGGGEGGGEGRGALRVVGATTASIYFACASNYRIATARFATGANEPVDPSPEAKRRVDAAVGKGADAFLAEHRADVRGLLGRVTLDLGGDAADAARPTDELLADYAKGRHSRYLESVYFQFGRHLLAASSRPGTLPANLQGVWSAHRNSPWGSGYWHNINVQMNYWPAFSCNLAECFEAYAAFNAAFRPATRAAAVAYARTCAPGGALDARTVRAYRDHPAILAWYINDESAPGLRAKLTRRRAFVEALDPDRPTYSVLYQHLDVRKYMGSLDVVGTDPYPVPDNRLSMAAAWTRDAVSGTFGLRPVWQVPQIFDWGAYVPARSKRPPTRAEMRSMAWQCIACGANGLVFYAFMDLCKTVNGVPFESRWADVCAMGGEIARFAPVMLAAEGSAAFRAASPEVAVRSWRLDGRDYVLAVDLSGKAREVTLASDAARTAVTPVFGPPVRLTGPKTAVVPLAAYEPVLCEWTGGRP